MRSSTTRLALLALVSALLLAGCNGLIDQTATYTTQPTQTITGTAPTRNGDPLTGVTVNGSAATLNGQQYSAVIPLDGTAIFNRVLVVASYQSGFTSTERSTVAYADGTHATVVAPGATITGGGGVRLTAAGITKLLPDVAAAMTLDTSALNYPTTSCGTNCSVSQQYGPSIGAPGNHPSLALTSASTFSLEATLPLVEEFLQVHYLSTTCSLTVQYSQVKSYGTFNVTAAAGTSEPFRVRPNNAFGSTLLFTRSTSGCATVPSALLTVAVNSVDPVVTNGVTAMLNEPFVSPTGSAPWPTPVSTALESVLSPLVVASATPSSGVTYTAPVSSAGNDGNGTLLGEDVTSTAGAVASGAPAQADSLGIGAAAAAAPGSTDRVGHGFDLAVGASYTTLNQALAVATEGGAFNQTLTAYDGNPLTYNGLDTLVGLGGALATDRPVQLVITPELAPAVTEGATVTDQAFSRLHVGGLRVSAQFADTKSTFLSFVIDFDTDVVLDANGGFADLAVLAPQDADEHVDVLTHVGAVPVAAAQGLFDGLQDAILGSLESGVPVFPLPTLSGHTLTEVSDGSVSDSAYLFLTIG
jgi:hypothetical protein